MAKVFSVTQSTQAAGANFTPTMGSHAETKRMQVVASSQQPTQEAPVPVERLEPDAVQILQAVAGMQQPISITVPVTVDGKGQTVKQGRAVRQEDGSYVMESVETPVGIE